MNDAEYKKTLDQIDQIEKAILEYKEVKQLLREYLAMSSVDGKMDRQKIREKLKKIINVS